MVEFNIFRYDPDKGGEPYFQKYQFEPEKGMTILEGLIYINENLDPSVAYRASCREAVCGSCAMHINDMYRLACKTQISVMGSRITLRPLSHLPILKDLVVDLNPFFDHFKEIKPYFIPKEQPPQKEYIQSPKDRKKIDAWLDCILCGCCYGFVIVYNGEVYNYLELRDELKAKGYRFFSDSDTEVILNAFDCWREGCLNRFIGMFAFAIWDRQRRALFVARDRLGIKPFYYFLDHRCFVFASEIKAILEVPGIHPEPNNGAIFEYLHFTYTLEDKTWFKGIKKLMPGHFGVLTERGWSCSKYWDVAFDGSANSQKREHELVEELRELIIDSVRLRLRSDVPVGAHLSGGLDSSSVVALARKELGELQTFSIGFNEDSSDERRWSNIVKEYLGTDHSVRVVTHHDLPSYLEKITWLLDEPVIGGPVYPQLKLNEMVKEKGVKVVLGGQGGDELFGGYVWHYASLFKDRLRNVCSGNLKELSHLLLDIAGLRGRYTMKFLLGG